MTNSIDTIKIATGSAVSVAGTITSYTDAIEQWSRIGASWIAIISGCFVIYSVIQKMRRDRKRKKP